MVRHIQGSHSVVAPTLTRLWAPLVSVDSTGTYGLYKLGLGPVRLETPLRDQPCEYAIRIMPVSYRLGIPAFPLHSISRRDTGVIRCSCLYVCTSVHLYICISVSIYAWTSITTVRRSSPRQPGPPRTLSNTSAPQPAAGGEGVVLPESGSATALPPVRQPVPRRRRFAPPVCRLGLLRSDIDKPLDLVSQSKYLITSSSVPSLQH